jgi:tetratricopeptide (TPR) repeat protein
MSRPQWITAVIALLVVAGLYAATEQKIFGPPPVKISKAGTAVEMALSTDSILALARKNLSPAQATRLNFLEHSITRGDVQQQQLHVYHQLASFWADSIGIFAPYAWYAAEAARLENSEKSLTFAAHLLLNNLVQEESPELKQWEAFQAKDLFERSLKLDPANDSSKVGLGAVYLFGGLAQPMEGINMIREVAERDTANIYAQWTLGQASLISGQLEKAMDRFKRIAALEPGNLEAILMVAEISERMGKNEEAVAWYSRVLPLITHPDMRKEVEERIAKLKK